MERRNIFGEGCIAIWCAKDPDDKKRPNPLHPQKNIERSKAYDCLGGHKNKYAKANTATVGLQENIAAGIVKMNKENVYAVYQVKDSLSSKVD